MDALISIKPKYVNEIISGNKKYEYRKCIFKKEINRIYIYSTSPDMKIMGFISYNGYIKGSPIDVWNLTKDYSGISEDEYFKYFNDSKVSYAINLEQIYIFYNPIDPRLLINQFIAPQSYYYLRGELGEKLRIMV